MNKKSKQDKPTLIKLTFCGQSLTICAKTGANSNHIRE